MIGVYAGHRRIMPARVSVWTATSILMDTATTLRMTTATAPSTPTANVTPTAGRRTPTPRASTSTERSSTERAIITLIRVAIITGTMDSAIIEGAMNIGIIIAEMECMIIIIAAAIIMSGRPRFSPLPPLLSSLPLPDLLGVLISATNMAMGSGGALKLFQRVRAELGRQTVSGAF